MLPRWAYVILGVATSTGAALAVWALLQPEPDALLLALGGLPALGGAALLLAAAVTHRLPPRHARAALLDLAGGAILSAFGTGILAAIFEVELRLAILATLTLTAAGALCGWKARIVSVAPPMRSAWAPRSVRRRPAARSNTQISWLVAWGVVLLAAFPLTLYLGREAPTDAWTWLPFAAGMLLVAGLFTAELVRDA